ncbi:MAG: DUF1844 domain-containing protein [candidate division WOR-3 bacterium]|nr:MAG: DUF1844 domain-containing protein [candidate division WOR-3 bacterium]
MQEKNSEKEKNDAQHEEPKLLDQPIKAKEIIYMMILSLEGKAWAYLDKVAHAETQKHQKDTGEAKVAIDAIEALFSVIEPGLEAAEKNDIQVRLTNLRLNFAKE